jgi:hypothetical protein
MTRLAAAMLSVTCSGLLACGFAARADAAAAAAQVALDESNGVVNVTIDGKPFTTYHFDDKTDPKFVRPYFYPVLAADGTALTSDQIITTKNDKKPEHPHHRSFYVAHGDVDGVDHWTLAPKDKTKPPHQKHVGFDKVDGDTIVERLEWEGKDRGPAILTETRTWQFFAFPDGARGVDLTVALTPAGDKAVTLKDTKEAGLCSVRVTKSISDKATLTNSAGKGGEGTKGEKETWGKPATWCDISGMIAGKPYGVAILDDPKNPASPARWHVRAYGLMSANPWALHDYDPKANPAGAGDMKLEPGKATTFRYRVVFHEGDAKSAKLDEKYAAFAK